MADINNNKKVELVLKDQENSIKVFKIRWHSNLNISKVLIYQSYIIFKINK
jgi:hypothetical protein